MVKCMTAKKNKIAPPATNEPEPKPECPPSPATTEDKQAAEEINEAKPEPFQLIPSFKISSKAKGMAKTVGIDLSSVEQMAPRINDWAASVEQRMNAILEAIPQLPAETIKALRAEAEKQRSQIQQQQTAQPAADPSTGFNIGSLMQLLPQVLGSGSGGNALNEEIQKKIVEAGLQQMFAGTELLKAMQTKMLANMGAEVVQKAMPT